MHANNKDADQPVHPQSDQGFCFLLENKEAYNFFFLNKNKLVTGTDSMEHDLPIGGMHIT